MPEPIDTWSVAIDADTSMLEAQLADAARLGAKFGDTLSRAFVDVSLKGKGLGDVLRSLTLSLSQMALKAAFKPLTDSLGTALASAVAGAFASGGVIRRGLPVPFASGGVIAAPTLFPLANGRIGLAGERGAEAIMPLAGSGWAARRCRHGSRRPQRYLQCHRDRCRELPPLRNANRCHADACCWLRTA